MLAHKKEELVLGINNGILKNLPVFCSRVGLLEMKF